MMRVILPDPLPFKSYFRWRQLLSIVHRGGAVRYFVQGNGALCMTRLPCLLVHSTTMAKATISSARVIAYKAFG
jgi:hypothetical protein